MQYLELLYAAHAHHIAVVSGPYLRWLGYASCVLVAGGHGWRRHLCRDRDVDWRDLVSRQLREPSDIGGARKSKEGSVGAFDEAECGQIALERQGSFVGSASACGRRISIVSIPLQLVYRE